MLASVTAELAVQAMRYNVSFTHCYIIGPISRVNEVMPFYKKKGSRWHSNNIVEHKLYTRNFFLGSAS